MDPTGSRLCTIVVVLVVIVVGPVFQKHDISGGNEPRQRHAIPKERRGRASSPLERRSVAIYRRDRSGQLAQRISRACARQSHFPIAPAYS